MPDVHRDLIVHPVIVAVAPMRPRIVIEPT